MTPHSSRFIIPALTLLILTLASPAGAHRAEASEHGTITIDEFRDEHGECVFTVHASGLGGASGWLLIDQTTEGSAPDRTLHEEEWVGTPDTPGGWQFEAGPFDSEWAHPGGGSVEAINRIEVTVAFTVDNEEHFVVAPLFDLDCETEIPFFPSWPSLALGVAGLGGCALYIARRRR